MSATPQDVVHESEPVYASYPSLRGRTAFVSGGASGLGAEFVEELAAQGARVTELLVLLGINGVGRLTFHALQNLDLPVILATVIYASFFVVAANALVDMLYAVIDPRVRA